MLMSARYSSRPPRANFQSPHNASEASGSRPLPDYYSMRGITGSNDIISDNQQPQMPFVYGQKHWDPQWQPLAPSDVTSQSHAWQTPLQSEGATQTQSASAASSGSISTPFESRSSTLSRSETPRSLDVALIQGIEDGRPSMGAQDSLSNFRPLHGIGAVASNLDGANIRTNENGYATFDRPMDGHVSLNASPTAPSYPVIQRRTMISSISDGASSSGATSPIRHHPRIQADNAIPRNHELALFKKKNDHHVNRDGAIVKPYRRRRSTSKQTIKKRRTDRISKLVTDDSSSHDHPNNIAKKACATCR